MASILKEMTDAETGPAWLQSKDVFIVGKKSHEERDCDGSLNNNTSSL